MPKFNIKCTDKSDGSTMILHTKGDKDRVIAKLKDSYTLKEGEIVEQLELGHQMQTMFFTYERDEK